MTKDVLAFIGVLAIAGLAAKIFFDMTQLGTFP